MSSTNRQQKEKQVRFFEFMRMLIVTMSLIVFCSAMTFIFWTYQRTETTLTKIESVAAAYTTTAEVMDSLNRGRRD